MSQPHSLRAGFLLAGLAIAITCNGMQNPAAPHPVQISQEDAPKVFWYKTPISLGADSFVLHPAGQKFYILASVEDKRFNHLEVSRVRTSPFVIDRAGSLWMHYPEEITFRVTASAVQDNFAELDTTDIDEGGDINSFLLGLKFRLKAYRGLDMEIREPAEIKMIGMPADVAYDERVSRVTFDTGDLPVDTRLVLEVLSPGGQLLSRFHLELL